MDPFVYSTPSFRFTEAELNKAGLLGDGESLKFARVYATLTISLVGVSGLAAQAVATMKKHPELLSESRFLSAATIYQFCSELSLFALECINSTTQGPCIPDPNRCVCGVFQSLCPHPRRRCHCRLQYTPDLPTITASPGTATTRHSFTVRISSQHSSPSPLADTPISLSSRSVESLTPRSMVSGTMSVPRFVTRSRFGRLTGRPSTPPASSPTDRWERRRNRVLVPSRCHPWFYLFRYRPRGLPRDSRASPEKWGRGCRCGMA